MMAPQQLTAQLEKYDRAWQLLSQNY